MSTQKVPKKSPKPRAHDRRRESGRRELSPQEVMRRYRAPGGVPWHEVLASAMTDPARQDVLAILRADARRDRCFTEPVVVSDKHGELQDGVLRTCAALLERLPTVEVATRWKGPVYPSVRVQVTLGSPASQEHRFHLYDHCRTLLLVDGIWAQSGVASLTHRRVRRVVRRPVRQRCRAARAALCPAHRPGLRSRPG